MFSNLFKAHLEKMANILQEESDLLKATLSNIRKKLFATTEEFAKETSMNLE